MTIFEIKRDYEALKSIASALHWMARRYADGRQSYVTSMFNELTRALLRRGVELNRTGDGTIWARDAMGRAYDGLTESEAAEGRPLPNWRDWEDEENQRLRDALRFYVAQSSQVMVSDYEGVTVDFSTYGSGGSGERAKQALGIG